MREARPCSRPGCSGTFRPVTAARRFCSSRCALVVRKVKPGVGVNAGLVQVTLRVASSVAARLKGRDPTLVLLRGLAALELDEGRAARDVMWRAARTGAPLGLPDTDA